MSQVLLIPAAQSRAGTECSRAYYLHHHLFILFVNKQKEEVMTELGAPATLSSSPGLRGRDERHP